MAGMGRRRAFLLAMLLCAGLLIPGARAQEDDGDADPQAAGGDGAGSVPAGAGSAPRPPFVQLKEQDSWVLEGCAVAFLLAFLVNLAVGRGRNERLAVAWTTEVIGSRLRLSGALQQGTGAGQAASQLAASLGEQRQRKLGGW